MATSSEIIERAKKRVADAEVKLKQAKALAQKAEAKVKNAESKKIRADDTRRKILAGSLVLEMMKSDEDTKHKFLNRLRKHLTRADDRALFGLEPAPASEEKTNG